MPRNLYAQDAPSSGVAGSSVEAGNEEFHSKRHWSAALVSGLLVTVANIFISRAAVTGGLSVSLVACDTDVRGLDTIANPGTSRSTFREQDPQVSCWRVGREASGCGL